ncbi:MAG: Crp/Fnr family transcriptional regulator [Pseudomonadota bacterium]
MALHDPFDRFVDEVMPPNTDKDLLSGFRSLSRRINAVKGSPALTANGSDQIAFVASGSTKLVAHATRGREQVVSFQFADDLVLVPARTAHAYTLTALESGELIQFNADPFFALAGEQSGLVIILMERAYESLAHCREKSVTLGRATAQEKLAGFLLNLAERIGDRQGRGTSMTLPMSRRDIADALGLSIETVSRQFTMLRDQRLLETIGRSGITLSDLRALSERAGHLPVNA